MEEQIPEQKEIMVSGMIKKLVQNVMKNCTNMVQGIMFFEHRVVIKATLDEEECDKMLISMVVNKENVLRYLGRKYVPTWTEKGATFVGQKCIQKAFVNEDGSMTIRIHHSEPHKIYTDTIHVRQLFREQGFTFNDKIIYYIERVQINFQDVLLYNTLITEWGMKVPEAARLMEKKLMFQYGKIEKVIAIKRKSIKRKYLRGYVKRNWITWSQLRRCLSHTNYNEHAVRKLAMEIRNEQKEAGIKVRF